jgi:hypothetical protein
VLVALAKGKAPEVSNKSSLRAPRMSNWRLASARQIRTPILPKSLAKPRQFQAQKNPRDFEFGQLFLSSRRAYDWIRDYKRVYMYAIAVKESWELAAEERRSAEGGKENHRNANRR